MAKAPSDSELRARLRTAGIRLTRQRLALARVLFGSDDQHVTAESLRRDVLRSGTHVATGTVYNTLHRFAQAGLLREVAVDSHRSWFDTNTSHHHHFVHPETGQLQDIPIEGISVVGLPEPPSGTEVADVHILVRLRDESGSA